MWIFKGAFKEPVEYWVEGEEARFQGKSTAE
jgi:hypothetical protein